MKRTSLKHVNQMAAAVSLDIEDMFKWGLSDGRYWGHGLSQAVWDYTDHWDYWYDGITKTAMDLYSDDMLRYLEGRGLDTSPLREDSGQYDEDLAEQFERDVARAYSDAMRDAEQSEFYRLVERDVETCIEEVGAPYYTLLKLDSYWDAEAKKVKNRGFVETEHLHEAERVVFGFTRQWHKDTVACTTTYGGLRFTYDPDEIEAWADEAVDEVRKKIDTGYQIQECPDDDSVLSFFDDHNETAYLLEKRQEHWAWAARVTARMMQHQPTTERT